MVQSLCGFQRSTPKILGLNRLEKCSLSGQAMGTNVKLVCIPRRNFLCVCTPESDEGRVGVRCSQCAREDVFITTSVHLRSGYRQRCLHTILYCSTV